MTIALEHIQPEDWPAVNRVVDQLRSLVLDTGGQSLGIRVGHDAGVVFTASATAANKSVTHGLGRTPVAAFAMCDGAGTTGVFLTVSAFASTTFTVGGSYVSAITLTAPFYWVVIG